MSVIQSRDAPPEDARVTVLSFHLHHLYMGISYQTAGIRGIRAARTYFHSINQPHHEMRPAQRPVHSLTKFALRNPSGQYRPLDREPKHEVGLRPEGGFGMVHLWRTPVDARRFDFARGYSKCLDPMLTGWSTHDYLRTVHDGRTNSVTL